MKKAFKVILAIVLLVAVVVGVMFFVVLPATLNNAAKLQTYDFGQSDKVPSLTSVVGERKVTGVSTSASIGGAQQKSYTYETDTIGEVVNTYIDVLHAVGFLITQPIDGNSIKGGTQLGCASADEGKIILVDLAWDNTRVAVQLTKGDGTITPK